MDGWLILLRIVHIGAAMSWFGGAIIASFFLTPTAAALGQAGQPFMDHLIHRRRLGIFFPIVAGLRILNGAALYWRDSAGLQSAWITSPSGLAFRGRWTGGDRGLRRRSHPYRPERRRADGDLERLAAGDGVTTEAQRQRLERAGRRLRLASGIDLPLLLIAGLTMAIGRYL
jgi:hypothetical protein